MIESVQNGTFSEWFSNKLRWLSFVATWAVVCIHSRTERWNVSAEDWANSLQSLIAPIFIFAVPLFFLISGMMFVNSYERYGWKTLFLRKLRTLYVPLVIWSLVGMLVCLPIRFYAQNGVPEIGRFIGVPLMWVEATEGQHFWYVRSLLIIFAFSPIVYFISQRSLFGVLALVGILFLPEQWSQIGPLSLCLNTSLLWFTLGVFLFSRCPWLLNSTGHYGALIAVGGCILALGSNVKILKELGIIICLWGGYDFIDALARIAKYPRVLNVTFFVYCTHLLVLCWIGGALHVVCGTSAWSRGISYFVLWQTFWIDLLLANLARRFCPRVYGVLAGGR